MYKKVITGFVIFTFLLISAFPARAAQSSDARIAQLEKQVQTLRTEVDQLKALQVQALFLRDCVNKEKSTNNLKVSLKLASCTVEYFKKSKAAQAKK